MAEKTTILGHIVSYEQDVYEGIKYLMRDLDDDQKRVFFDQARSKGEAAFEDHLGRKFLLTHKDYGYDLTKDT